MTTEPTAADRSPWFTPAEAAAYTRLGQRTLRDHVAAGDLACHRRGRITRYHVDDLDAFLRAGRIPAAA